MQPMLVPHPANPSDAISQIMANAKRRRDMLSLSFRTLGRRDEVRWPDRLPSGFSDGLWQHSCFEGFVAIEGDSSYVELNMTSSRRWAAYRFDDYRAGMRRAEATPHSPFTWMGFDTTLLIQWRIPELPQDRVWQVGLSAVIETVDDTKNYFALAHPPGNPDFHNRDCFTLQVPPPDRP